MAIEVNGQKVSGIYVGSPPAIINTKLQNVVSLTNSTSNIKFIGDEIIAFNPSTDSLDVYKNSTFLTRDIDYSINTDNQSIDKIDGVWEYNADEPTKFTFIVGRNQINNLVFGDGQSIENGTITYNKLHREVTDKINKFDNGVILSPTINLGMNNVIHKTDGVESFPKFTIQGKSYVNLLGKDGNCKDISKWSENGADIALDISSKVFGTSSIKVTSNGTYTWGGTRMYPMLPLINSKHYLITGYIRNINTSKEAYLYLETVNGGTGSQTPIITSTDKFIRVACTVSPLQLGESVHSNLHLFISGDKGQSADFDGIMINEITADEYDNLSVDQLLDKYPYVDSYACLENPYIEVKHDNLVRNSNGEEGIGWWNPQNSNITVSIENNKLKVVNTAGSSFSAYQPISVKKNTDYYINATVSGDYATLYVFGIDEFGVAGLLLSRTSNVTFNTGNYSKVEIRLRLSQAGTGYFDHIMLVEGTTPPTSYKPCRIERCVIEGKFSSDDSFTYKDGEVSGLLNWKHRTLYGKDYDWIYHGNYTGYKAIKIANFDRLATFSSPSTNTIGIKYDGKILTTQSVVAGTDGIYHGSDYYLYTTLSDSDTGWTEAINPNADEVKAFMNGWRAISHFNNRYVAFVSVVDGSVPSMSTSIPISATTNTNSVTVASGGTQFVNGDFVAIVSSAGVLRNLLVVSGVPTDTNIPLNGTINVVVGDKIFKADNGSTDTSLLTYCKNNIAPGYEGYQINYKLKNPEPLTDVNTHIHGNIPKFDEGDNYLYLDSGYVLGEVSNPVKGSDGLNRINDGYLSSYHGESYLQNKNEIINTIYRNNIFDNPTWVWTPQSWGEIYGNYGLFTTSENSKNIDLNATYTVDYQILKTLHTSPSLVQMSYQQNILSTIDDLFGSINSRQKHDSALETIVGLSTYEQVTFGANAYITPIKFASVVGLFIELPFKVTKKTIPTITISSFDLHRGYDNTIVTNVFKLHRVTTDKNKCILEFASSDSVDMAQWYYGYYGSVTVVADCRGRV